MGISIPNRTALLLLTCACGCRLKTSPTLDLCVRLQVEDHMTGRSGVHVDKQINLVDFLQNATIDNMSTRFKILKF
jgi:hypothetical protein